MMPKIKSNKMTTETVNSTVNFMYFANNFPHDWIAKVWSDNLMMTNHLTSKWFALNESNGQGGTVNFFKLFMQLDGGNQTQLLTWIEENYTNK